MSMARADTTPAPAAAFEAANRLYEQGQFLEAAQAYAELWNQGTRSAALLYNQGNAWFKAGQIGRAVATYRQALDLTPRDPELRANLQFARQQVQGASWRPAWYETTLQSLTLNEWTLLTLLPFWATLLLLTLGQLRPAIRSRLRPWIWAGTLSTAVLASLLAITWYGRQTRPIGVVIVGNAPVRNGPFEESPVLFTVYDGAELRILERKTPWLRVTADGVRSGWLHETQISLPPRT
jgi:tetratricopeptide (TPR) repeat protein